VRSPWSQRSAGINPVLARRPPACFRTALGPLSRFDILRHGAIRKPRLGHIVVNLGRAVILLFVDVPQHVEATKPLVSVAVCARDEAGGGCRRRAYSIAAMTCACRPRFRTSSSTNVVAQRWVLKVVR
jgi:hypothetical protein